MFDVKVLYEALVTNVIDALQIVLSLASCFAKLVTAQDEEELLCKAHLQVLQGIEPF